MPTPTVNIARETIGRTGHVTVMAEWTPEDASDIKDFTILDPDIHISGKYQNTRFQVLDIQYDSDDGTEVRVEFDSIPLFQEALIVAAAGSVTQGSRDFRGTLQGCRPDPNPTTPSKIILTTIGAVPGTALFIEMNYRESGTRPN